MAEIEFSVLSRSCLRQRIPDQETLRRRGRLNAGLDRSATPVKKMASQMAPAPTPQPTRGRCLLGRRPSMPTAGPTGGAGRRTVQSGLPHTAGTGDALSDTLPVRLPHILPDRPDNATCKEVPGGHDLRLGDRDHLPPNHPAENREYGSPQSCGTARTANTPTPYRRPVRFTVLWPRDAAGAAGQSCLWRNPHRRTSPRPGLRPRQRTARSPYSGEPRSNTRHLPRNWTGRSRQRPALLPNWQPFWNLLHVDWDLVSTDGTRLTGRTPDLTSGVSHSNRTHRVPTGQGNDPVRHGVAPGSPLADSCRNR